MFQVSLTLMYEYKVIYVAAIVVDTEVVFNKMVEGIEIKVCKYLTGEVSYGKATAGGGVEEAFILGQPNPVAMLSPYPAICCRTAVDGFPA